MTPPPRFLGVLRVLAVYPLSTRLVRTVEPCLATKVCDGTPFLTGVDGWTYAGKDGSLYRGRARKRDPSSIDRDAMFFESCLLTTSRRRTTTPLSIQRLKGPGLEGCPTPEVFPCGNVNGLGLAERAAPANGGITAHGPDQVPLIPWLPLSLEPCEDL